MKKLYLGENLFRVSAGELISVENRKSLDTCISWFLNYIEENILLHIPVWGERERTFKAGTMSAIFKASMHKWKAKVTSSAMYKVLSVLCLIFIFIDFI